MTGIFVNTGRNAANFAVALTDLGVVAPESAETGRRRGSTPTLAISGTPAITVVARDAHWFARSAARGPAYLAGYANYCGRNASVPAGKIVISSPAIAACAPGNPARDTFDAGITASTMAGADSAQSNICSQAIPQDGSQSTSARN